MLEAQPQLVAREDHRLDRPGDEPLQVGMRGALDPAQLHDVLHVEVVPNATELHGEQSAELAVVGGRRNKTSSKRRQTALSGMPSWLVAASGMRRA